MNGPREPAGGMVATAFDGLAPPAREFLLQMLLYKSVFISNGFAELIARESSPQLREQLQKISAESAKEAAAIIDLVREWDAGPGAWEHVSLAVAHTREQLLHDLIRLKEGMTEAGLFAAMRAPTSSLRERFLHHVDVDRRHADEMRAFLGATTTAGFRAAEEHGLGAHDARDRGASLDAAIRERLAKLEKKGARGRRLVVSPDGLRHLRDERGISEDGRWRELPIDIDVAWEGDVFAIQTNERLTYAELVVATRADAAGETAEE